MKTYQVTYTRQNDPRAYRTRIVARDKDEARATVESDHPDMYGGPITITDIRRFFVSIDEIRQANQAAGGHWFSPGTLRWFNSRIHADVYAGRYFVTSEQNPEGERRYTVREVSEDGDIKTAEGCEFFEYASRSGAHNRARQLAFKENYPGIKEVMR